MICWLPPDMGEVRYREAEQIDLLALKLIVEKTDLRSAAQQGNATLGQLQKAIDNAIAEGLLLSPESLVRRSSSSIENYEVFDDSFLSTDIFTLQWHVTQACDLHCKHCYDRSDRSSMPLTMAMGVLDGFFNFLALLPDGEVHACRKFPSRIGNILDGTLYDIYHSEKAQQYRSGSVACSDCRLNPVCRGCLAIAHSTGLEVFKDKDPFCFASSEIFEKR